MLFLNALPHVSVGLNKYLMCSLDTISFFTPESLHSKVNSVAFPLQHDIEAPSLQVKHVRAFHLHLEK